MIIIIIVVLKLDSGVDLTKPALAINPINARIKMIIFIILKSYLRVDLRPKSGYRSG